MKFVDGISVYSDSVSRYIQNNFGFESSQIGVFPNVQNESVISNKLTKVSSYDIADADLLLKSHVILYVGRLESVKNLNYLIKAFILARAKGLEARLVIVGSGSMEDDLRKSCSSHKVDIIFPGKVLGDSIYQYYLLADLFILPSTFEPFGAVVNEALICGVPTFCSNTAGASELIHQDHNGATFCPRSAPQSLAEMMLNFFKGRSLREKHEIRGSLMPRSFKSYSKSWLPHNVS